MPNFELTNEAVTDLESIWNYTFENWSENQADKYYNLLINMCQNISENPNLGKNYSEIRSDLKGLRVKSHIIFYRIIEEKPIEITRILYGRMDLKRRLER